MLKPHPDTKIKSHPHDQLGITIEDVSRGECLLFLSQDLEIEEGAVSDLIIIVHQAAIQQHQDTRQEVFTRRTKLSQGGDGS